MGVLGLAEALINDLNEAMARLNSLHELVGETFGGSQESAFRAYYESILTELGLCANEMQAITAVLQEGAAQ